MDIVIGPEICIHYRLVVQAWGCKWPKSVETESYQGRLLFLTKRYFSWKHQS